VLYGDVRASVDTGPSALEPDPNKVNQGAFRGRLFFDQLDNANFPRSGYGGRLEVFNSTTGLGATQNYTKWSLDGQAAHSFGDHTFNLGLRFGGKIGGDPIPGYDQFNWGGFLQQSGYRTGALLGESIQFGRLVYFNRLARFTLIPGIYAGVSLEAGRVGTPFIPGNQTGTLLSAAAFFGLDSPIGPVYLGYGRTESGFSSFYFYLGRP
jgi:NTE family protein